MASIASTDYDLPAVSATQLHFVATLRRAAEDAVEATGAPGCDPVTCDLMTPWADVVTG